MNIALTCPDDFWEPGTSGAWSSSAEDFVFLSIVAGILFVIFLAISAPQQRTDTEPPAISLRIKTPAAVEQQPGKLPVAETVGPEPAPPPVPQYIEAPSRKKAIIPQSEKPEKKLDLSLPQAPTTVRYRQFGIINKLPESGFGMQSPNHGAAENRNETSSDTYEAYVNAYGDLLVEISDHCTMNLGSSFGLFDSDIQKVARISCKRNTGKKRLDLLFNGFQDQLP